MLFNAETFQKRSREVFVSAPRSCEDMSLIAQKSENEDAGMVTSTLGKNASFSSTGQKIKSNAFGFYKYVILLLIVCVYSPVLLAADELSIAPVNPEFVARRTEAETVLAASQDDQGHTLGLIPSPLDRSHLISQASVLATQLAGTPSSYDLRTLGYVTPIRDQGSCGSCWAFGSYGPLESWLLMNAAETWDLSENHLKNYHGFDPAPCAGGNADMSTAYLARWAGPVSEADDPYHDLDDRPSPGGPCQKYLNSALWFFTDTNIKNALMTYGGMYTSMRMDLAYYNSSEYTYYYNGSNSANHAVTLIGWDDSKVVTGAPGSGAWLIKNSWGTGWGDSGFFWISYYDSVAVQYAVAFCDAVPTSSYATNYQYDPLGWTTSVGYSSTTAWAANIFTPTANERLTAVGLYAGADATSYIIYVYDTFYGGTFSSLLGSVSGTLSNSGYHTIPLTSPIDLTTGNDFSVVVKFTTPDYNYPIPVEMDFAGYSSGATAGPGQSYVSSTGTTFTDITTYGEFENTNVCIRGLTITAPSLLWSDGFESGNFIAGGWTVAGSASVTTGAKYTGTYGARIPGSGGSNSITKSKSTAGYNTIHVKYDRRTTRTSLTLVVDWSTDGSTWNTLETTTSTSWASRDYTLDPNANNNPNFRIRFRTTAGFSSRYAYIDNVQITGTQNQYTLTINTLGSGTVAKSPDKATYNPGEVATLTANPSAGWSFGVWSGDAGGSDNPKTIIMDGNKSVTATFTQNEYILTVNTVGNGTVAKLPDQATYHYGDTVQLTASAAVGWSFAAWSSDVGGSDNPKMITIDGNKTVIANFTINQITISGHVREPDGNTPVEGVLIQTDTNDINTVTDANGYYGLWVDYGWSGVVTPQKEGYIFEPNSNAYTNVTQNYSEANYTATLITFKISGRVFEQGLVTPIIDVNIAAENGGGSWTSKYGGGSDITDANGYYEIRVDYNWDGNVAPTKYAYGFEPNRRRYSDVNSDQNDQDYTGRLLTFAISGYIRNDCNVPIAGVLVDANTGGGEAITDVNGFYEVWVDYNWSGAVTPTKKYYTFEPNQTGYVDVLADYYDQNYIAYNIYDLDCDGFIGFGDIAVISENWLETGENIPGDIYKDENNIVNFLDFSMFAEVWEED